MKKIFLVVVFASVSLLMNSCKNEEALPTAYVDTYLVSKKVDGTTVYGLGMYAYANTNMKSVVATGPDDTAYTLDAAGNYLYEYYWETDDEAYTTSKPATGDYTFNVEFSNGDSDTKIASLTSSVLTPPVFTTCAYDADNDRIDLAWDYVSGTDYIVIVMRDSDGNAVWLSSSLSSSTVSAKITSSSSWLDGYSVVTGETYTITLSIFEYDDDSSTYIQAKALTSQTVTWGN